MNKRKSIARPSVALPSSHAPQRRALSVAIRRTAPALALGACFLSTHGVFADSYTYTGTGTTGFFSNNFTDNTTSATNVTPVGSSTTTLTFNYNGQTGYTATDDQSGSFSLAQLIFGNNGGTTAIGANSGDTLIFTGAAGTNFITQNGSGAVTINSNILNSAANGLIFNGSGAGITKVFAQNTFSGGVTISSGTVQVKSSFAFGGSVSNAALNLLTINGGSLDLGGLSNNSGLRLAGLAGSGGSVINSAAAANTNVLNLFGTSGGTYSGSISGSGGTGNTGKISINENLSAGAVQKFSGTNTYTGTTQVNSATLQFGQEVSLYNDTTASWTAANLLVASGATLAFNVGGTGEFTTGDVSTLLTNLDGAVNNNGLKAGSIIGFDTTNAAGGNFTISNAIANTTGTGGGAVGLTKLGTNTLTLNAANTYTGGTTVNAGTLALAYNTGDTQNGTLSNNAPVTVNSGGTLQFNIEDALGYGFGASAALNIVGGTVTSANVANTTPVQSGGTSFRVTLPTLSMTGGTLSSGTNNNGDAYGGSYLIGNVNSLASGATSVINANSVSIGNPSTFTVAQGTTASGVDLSVSSVLENFAGGAASLIKAGAGTLLLTGANTYANGTTVNGGKLVAGFATGGLNPTSGALGNGQAATNVITVNNGGTVQTTASDVLGNADTVPVAAVQINSGGNFTATNNLTTLGAVTLSGGTLTADGGVNLGNGPNGVIKGAIDLNGTVSATGSGVTSTLASINNTGNATFDLNNTGTHNTTFDVASGATLNATGVIADTWFNGAGGLTKTDSGTLTLANTNTYSGGTTVNAGTVSLSANQADGTGVLIVGTTGTGGAEFSGGTVDLNTNTTTQGSATGAGNVTLSNGGTLFNGAGTTTSPAAGVVVTGTANGSGGLGSGDPPTNDTQNFGTLTVSGGNTFIDFGAGNTGGVFKFANSSGAAWTGTLDVYDWNGNFPTALGTQNANGTYTGGTGGGGLDELFFGTDQTGLTAAQLGDIQFFSGQGTGALGPADILTSGEVVAAPEPQQAAMLALMAAGLGGLILRARKRRAGETDAA